MFKPDGIPIGVITAEGVELRGTHVSILGPSQVVFSYEPSFPPRGGRSGSGSGRRGPCACARSKKGRHQPPLLSLVGRTYGSITMVQM
jgi:hypothetical protein